MPNSKIWLAVRCGVIAGVSLHAFAQQSPASNDHAPSADAAAAAALIAKANATAAKEAATAENGKTVEDKSFTKRAILAGWHPEVQHGVTVYCPEEPIVGSRFTKRLCGSQVQLAVVLEQQQFERDQLKQRGCGRNCGGHEVFGNRGEEGDYAESAPRIECLFEPRARSDAPAPNIKNPSF